jgi:hypothetical protein
MTRIDTQYAATVMRKPVFPRPRATQLFFQRVCSCLNLATREKLNNLQRDCLGFAFLKTFKGGTALLQNVFEVWSMLECYDYFLRHPYCGIDLFDIIQLRRFLQHEVLSSDPATEPLHKLSRLAILAFIADCLSPLYPGRAFHRNMAEAMKMAVLECIGSGGLQPNSELLLWVLVLGGYIARETPLRSWYVQQLRNSSVMASGANWDFVQKSSEQYLPFLFKPGRHCLEVWNEACMLPSYGRSGDDRSYLDEASST